jgi:hypothetical protein
MWEADMRYAELFTQGIEAVNARDWEAHRAMLADDIIAVDFSTGETTTGADAFVQQQRTNATAFPDQVISVTSICETGNVVWAELLCEGTQTGPLSFPTGEMAPTGRRALVHAAVMCEYDAEGLACRTHAYLNPMELMAQLGGAPAAPNVIDLTAHAPAPTS